MTKRARTGRATTGRARVIKAAAAMAVVGAVVLLSPDGDPARSGPVLQRLASRQAHILVHRAQLALGTLTLRLAAKPEEPLAEFRVSNATRRLRFVLTGLEPVTHYLYDIVLNENHAYTQHFSGSFQTAPEAGHGSLRFAAFGDSGRIPWWRRFAYRVPAGPAKWHEPLIPGAGHQWDIARRVAKSKAELVLHLGDIVYPRGAREHYNEAFFDPFAQLLATIPIWPTIGNHDAITENAQPLLDFFDIEGRYYDFVDGPVQFFCLDTFTSSLEPGSEQRAWLEQALAASTAPWKVAFTHRPFFTVSRSQKDSQNAMLRREIHPILAKHGVSLVFSGHDHNYQRFKVLDGVNYIVAGGGGKSLYTLGTSKALVVAVRQYSFALVDVDQERCLLRGINDDGEEIDRLEIKRPQ